MKISPVSYCSIIIISIFLLSAGCSAIVLIPSADDEREAGYVASIVKGLLPPKSESNSQYTLYACRQPLSFEVTIYTLTDQVEIDKLCQRIETYKGKIKALSSRTVDLLFYEKENFINVQGSSKFQERQEVLLEKRRITLPDSNE